LIKPPTNQLTDQPINRRGEYTELEGLHKATDAQRREYTARYAFQLLDQDADGEQAAGE
jgi:hypothetical protein